MKRIVLIAAALLFGLNSMAEPPSRAAIPGQDIFNIPITIGGHLSLGWPQGPEFPELCEEPDPDSPGQTNSCGFFQVGITEWDPSIGATWNLANASSIEWNLTKFGTFPLAEWWHAGGISYALCSIHNVTARNIGGKVLTGMEWTGSQVGWSTPWKWANSYNNSRRPKVVQGWGKETYKLDPITGAITQWRWPYVYFNIVSSQQAPESDMLANRRIVMQLTNGSRIPICDTMTYYAFVGEVVMVPDPGTTFCTHTIIPDPNGIGNGPHMFQMFFFISKESHPEDPYLDIELNYPADWSEYSQQGMPTIKFAVFFRYDQDLANSWAAPYYRIPLPPEQPPILPTTQQ